MLASSLRRTLLQKPWWVSCALCLGSSRLPTVRALSVKDRPPPQPSSSSPLVADCHALVQAALQAVDPAVAIRRHVQLEHGELVIDNHGGGGTHDKQIYDLEDYEQVVIVAFGKAASRMATTLVQQLDPVREKVTGLVLTKDEHATESEKEILQAYGLTLCEASHPVPDHRGVTASQQILELVERTASKHTLLLTCISGGGSALLCAPQAPLTLEDLQATNTGLLQAGWPIDAMNVIRKRLETLKGGRLAAAAYPSSVVSLILSDVVGDPLDLIASGPTVPDTSSWQEAHNLLATLPIVELPTTVRDYLQQGVDGQVSDSPAANHPVFGRAQTVLVGNTAQAVEAAASKAKALGYHPIVLATQLQGEASELAQVYISIAQRSSQPHARFGVPLPAALLTGGESTVSLPPNPGLGGRNQELALAVALGLDNLPDVGNNVVFASVGTDGTDGPTDAAGAVIDGTTIARLGRPAAQQAMQEHDAYHYLQQKYPGTKESPLLKTGPTGTNVADVAILLIGKPPEQH
jgi:glycerate 2-kinase